MKLNENRLAECHAATAATYTVTEDNIPVGEGSFPVRFTSRVVWDSRTGKHHVDEAEIMSLRDVGPGDDPVYIFAAWRRGGVHVVIRRVPRKFAHDHGIPHDDTEDRLRERLGNLVARWVKGSALEAANLPRLAGIALEAAIASECGYGHGDRGW